jgi:hypothetical protein
VRETLYNSVKVVRALNATAVATNTATNGAAVDLDQTGADYRIATAVVFLGAWTDGAFAPKVQESADGSTGWTDVPAARVQGGASLGAAQAITEIGVIPDPGSARFIRVVVTSTGVTTGANVAALFLLGSPSSRPVVRP